MNEDDKRLLAEMREQSKDPNTPEALFYGMLQSAHPVFVEAMEAYAIKFKRAAEKIGEETQRADSDSELKKAWSQAMNNHAPATPQKDSSLNDPEDTNK